MCTQVLKEKMDVLRLTFYTAPVSVGILVPFFLMTEFRKLMSYGCASVLHLPEAQPHPSCSKGHRVVLMSEPLSLLELVIASGLTTSGVC